MRNKTIIAAGSVATLLLCSMLFAQEQSDPVSSKDIGDQGKHQEEAKLWRNSQ